MSNIIAKQFKFTLDSKSVKTYREKSFVCYNTDSIKFTIDIIEDGTPKSIVGANIEVNYSYPNGESTSMKQEFEDGIVIVGGSTIEITPKNIRIRKRILDHAARMRLEAKKKANK